MIFNAHSYEGDMEQSNESNSSQTAVWNAWCYWTLQLLLMWWVSSVIWYSAYY